MKLAFFDSGVGGMTTLAACLSLPASFYYYGDNIHAPYGGKSREEILSLACSAFSEFERLQVDAAVVACNTVTTLCIGELRNRFPFPVYGVEPAIVPAAAAAKRILVLCTKATASSPRFLSLLAAHPDCRFLVYSPVDWVRRIEASLPTLPALSLPFQKGDFDAVVLGCTHFIYLKPWIESLFCCPVFDGNAGIFNYLKKELGTNNHQNSPPDNPPLVTFLGGAKEGNFHLFSTIFREKITKNDEF